jgi:hypothetical protein
MNQIPQRSLSLAAALALSACGGAQSTSSAGFVPASVPQPLGDAKAQRVPLSAWPDILKQNGPKLYVYSVPVDGFTDPNNGGSSPDSGAFDELVYGQSSPPSSDLLSSATTFGGNPGNYIEFTNQPASKQASGAILLPCGSSFSHNSNSGQCVAAKHSTEKTKTPKISEVLMVQSWPLFVGDGGSSNYGSGTYGFEATSDDGTYFDIAPAAFTFTQPGDFQGATGLTAGQAVVANGGIHGPQSGSGSVQIAASTCAANIYWLTFQFDELEGGDSGFEYSWAPPGQGGQNQVTQAVVWGEVTSGSAPLAGATVKVTVPKGSPANLVTDAGGCFAYNYLPFSGEPTITVTATVDGHKLAQKAKLSAGGVTQVNLAF